MKLFTYTKNVADTGDKKAIANLGVCHQFGLGTEENFKAALACYEKTDPANYLIINQAYIYRVLKKRKKAIKLLKEIVKAPDIEQQAYRAEALYHIGYLYIKSLFSGRKKKKGVNYIAEAAIMHYTPAQYELARHYIKKKRRKKYLRQAIEHLKAAAQENHKEAQLLLAECLTKGKGVKKDREAAIHYEQLAQANPVAQYEIGIMHFQTLE